MATKPRRLPVRLHRDEALYVTRAATKSSRLVYVFVCDKKVSYPEERSRIAYIGMTKNGVWRVAASIAHRAKKILGTRGIYSFWVQIVTCRAKPGVKSWHKLERAMLLLFKERFGDVPICNEKGKAMKVGDEFSYFAKARIRRVLDDLS
jgi:hypothetical protein